MPEEKAVGCGKPTGALVGEEPRMEAPQAQTQMGMAGTSRVVVGKKAPDFVAPAYRQGQLTQVTLSDFLGKWVMLCFYPGDFTFV